MEWREKKVQKEKEIGREFRGTRVGGSLPVIKKPMLVRERSGGWGGGDGLLGGFGFGGVRGGVMQKKRSEHPNKR